MPIKVLVVVLAGLGAAFALAPHWTASADELTMADGDLALPDQPVGDETLTTQSGSTPVPVAGANSIQQDQRNTVVVPTPMTMSITKSATTTTANENSIASITSTVSTTIIRSGVQQTP